MRSKKAVLTEKRLQRKRELQTARKQRQRARLKNNVALHEASKQKELERYLKRKLESKVKSVSLMSPKELKTKRAYWRKHSSKHRRKKKEEREQVYEHIDKKTRGRKKVKSNRSSVYKALKKSEEKNVVLQKKVWALRKRATRKKKVLSPPKEADSPKTRVEKLTAGEHLGESVRKKLLFNEVIEGELKKFSKSKSMTDKHVINKIFGGKIIKKYKLLHMTRSFLSPSLLKRYEMTPEKRAEFNRKASLFSQNRTHNVISFFLRDDVSSVCPDKNAYVFNYKKGKVKKRKRYLRAPLTELYDMYCKAIPKPVSYTTFCRLKPFYCVMQKKNERNTCLCTTCENMKLLVEALHRSKILEDSSLSKLVSQTCCPSTSEECLLRTCENCASKSVSCRHSKDLFQVIKYEEWQNVHNIQKDKDGNVIKKTPKWKKVKCAENYSLVIEKFKNKFTFYMAHICRDFHQQSYFREKKSNLEPGDLYLHYDWSRNYDLKCNREIQSAFFGASNEEISLHTGMAYLNGKQQSFCTVSDNNKHTAPHVLAHIIPIIKLIIEENPGISTLYFQSDSPTSQYRNKDMFYLLTQFLTTEFPQITCINYGYSEAGHSKGPVDGIGGWCKNTLDQEVLCGNDITSADDAVEVLRRKTSRTKIMLIDYDAHSAIQDVIPQTLKPLDGTKSVHSFSWVKERKTQVYFASLSCNICAAGTQCTHYGLKSSPLNYAPTEGTTESHDEGGVDDPDPEPTRKSQTKKPKKQSKKYQLNDWVAVKFNNFWYPGVIEKVTQKLLHVNFMVKHTAKDDLFLWPPEEDKQRVKRSEVLFILNTPPVPVDRNHFSIEEKNEIDLLLENQL